MMTDPYGIFGIFKAQPMQPEHAEWLAACRDLAEKGDMDAITALYSVTDLPEDELRRYLSPLERGPRQSYRNPEEKPDKRQTGSSGADRGTGPCPGRRPFRNRYGRQRMEGHGHSSPFPGCGKGACGSHAATGGNNEGNSAGTGRKAFGGTALQKRPGNPAGRPLHRHEGKNGGRERRPPPASVRAGPETGQQ